MQPLRNVPGSWCVRAIKPKQYPCVNEKLPKDPQKLDDEQEEYSFFDAAPKDPTLARLLFDCKPLHFISIHKTNKETTETGHWTTKQVVGNFLTFLQSNLGIPPKILSFGPQCNQKTETDSQ